MASTKTDSQELSTADSPSTMRIGLVSGPVSEDKDSGDVNSSNDASNTQTIGTDDADKGDSKSTIKLASGETSSANHVVGSGAHDNLLIESVDEGTYAVASSIVKEAGLIDANDREQDFNQTNAEMVAETLRVASTVLDSNSLISTKEKSSSSDHQELAKCKDKPHKEMSNSTVSMVFPNDEDSGNMSPKNKLLEIILKEDDSESNLEAFIPEIHSSMEETESNLTGADTDSTAEKEVYLGLVIKGVISTFKENNIANDESVAADAEEGTSLDVDASADGVHGISQQALSDGDMQKTYITDFLYSDASDAAPVSEESKGFPLFRFPKIVKCIAAAEYSLLQELYKLIYIRNPWDTIEILSKRILDFSGFNFAQDSEDYFTRRVMLRTMSQSTLESIAKLLCLESKCIPSDDSAKRREELETDVMKFLHTPHRRARLASIKPKANKHIVLSKSKPASVGRGKSRKQKRSQPNAERRDLNNSKPNVTKSKGKEKYVEQVEDVGENILEKENERNVVTEIGVSEPDIKMKLKRSGKQDFYLVPAEDIPEPKEKFVKKPDVEEIQGDAEDGRPKLQDFPEILSNIEGTPEKILKDIHYLLYMKECEMDVLKENIMQFKGFSSDEHSKEYKERKGFLEKMSNTVIKNLVDTFYLMNQSDRDENINLILEFLKAPDKDLMKKAAEAPDMLMSDSKIKISMSDSDDSITFEIVTKKVDCIDLISSDDENDDVKVKSGSVAEGEPKLEPQYIGNEDTPKKRTLRNFETITKIVNTHPNEYLIDIYNLLYMQPSESSTLRKDILDFSGFEFEKGTPEYVRRKQYLDRMQYNSVRRIFNTLIHNTREVRVFSKPTMIADIFQFLFKLPDTDTSIRLPPLKSNSQPNGNSGPGLSMASLAALKAASGVSAANSTLNQSNSKLSELKRVFQRVACFPCEYLIDVHKLLFMKDCEMTEIRQRIFSFKGFPFDVDSIEFKNRKMYLEYLTFHSLRKISSVLTTRNVDLRNSTKHELATHLTKVLMEYTDLKPSDTDLSDGKGLNEIEPNTMVAISKDAAKSVSEGKIVKPVTKNIAESSGCSSVTGMPDDQVCSGQPNLEVSPVTSSTSAVETNILSSEIKGNTKNVTSSASTVETNILSSEIKGNTKNVTSSTSTVETNILSSENKRKYTPTFERIITPTVNQVQDKAKAETQSFNLIRSKRHISDVNNAPVVSSDDSISAMQFQDIHLPEVEKLVKNYQQGTSVLRGLRPKNVMINSSNVLNPARCNFQSIIQQKNQIGIPPRPYPVAISMPHPAHQLPYQIVSPFQAQCTVPTIYYSSSQPMVRSVEVLAKNDETCGCSESMPVECILTEGPDSGEPASKKLALSHVIASSQTSSQTTPTLSTRDTSSILENMLQKQATKSSSVMAQEDILHMKIRDAMIKGSDDEEEDCDKPLATLVGHPNDKILKQQICGIVENTSLQDITINGVIQKIFNMYPKFNLSYRKDFIKSTLRSLLYRLGEEEAVKSPNSSVSTTDPSDSLTNASSSSSFTSRVPPEKWSKKDSLSTLNKQHR